MKRIRTLALAAFASLALAAAAFAAESSPGTRMLDAYGAVHAALAADNADGVAASAAELASAADAAGKSAEDAAPFQRLATAARAMQGGDLVTLRDQFKEVSTAIAGVVEAGGLADSQLYYCSMAKAYWLQKAGDQETRNPYYGHSMLHCGAKVDKVGS